MKIKAGKIKKPVRSAKQMTVNAGIALKYGFYTEAVWILSGIMEARLKKIILLTEGKTPGAAFGLEQYLKRIKLLLNTKRYPALNSAFPLDLIISLRSWKNSRNVMMKDMLEVHISQDRKERLAKDGIRLMKGLNKVYKLYKISYQTPAETEMIKEELQPGQTEKEIITLAETAEDIQPLQS